MAAEVVAGEAGAAEFGILGPLEVMRSGQVLPLGGPRQRAVLALLLLEANRVVSMDRLADELGIDPGEPLRQLHQSVLAQDPALEWKDTSPALADAAPAGRADAADGAGAARVTDAEAAAGVGATAAPAAASTDTDAQSSRRRARRLLPIGLAAAVAAAVCIVVVTRPWSGEASAQLPANSVGLIDSAGGRVGPPVPVRRPDGVAYATARSGWSTTAWWAGCSGSTR